MGSGASSKNKPGFKYRVTDDVERIPSFKNAVAGENKTETFVEPFQPPDTVNRAPVVKTLSRASWAEASLTLPPQLDIDGRGLALAADVGGTNSRFMLYEVDTAEPIQLRRPAPGTLLLERRYGNLRFTSFAEVVDAFLRDAASENVCKGDSKPEVACLAVAGVCEANKCRLTNIDWIIDGPALGERFGIRYVEVINDFVAQGYGVLTLASEELLRLSGPEPVPSAPIACVGAGTGLGQCFLAPSPTGEYQAFPSEGGHAEFAPLGPGSDDTYIELLRYLKKKFSGWNRISSERVVSGKGICNVYEFLAHRSPSRIDKAVHEAYLACSDDASIIALNATPGSLCEESLKMFAACYGSVCGTFALQTMPFGGLYLTGGVTNRLQEFLQRDVSFRGAYFDKGRVSPMLEDIPLYIVKGDKMGQRGAHLRAVRLLHHCREGLILPAKAAPAPHLAPPRSRLLAELTTDGG